MKKNNLPKITYAIVTLNEEKRIEKCLKAIVAQDYPISKKEIIVMDGGSTDQTKTIAKRYGAKIYFNTKRLAEPGLALAYEKAKGDYMVFMAADNIMYDKQWTRKIVQPFLDDPQKILASFSRVTNDPRDNMWNKYINEDTDPFSAFVFGNASYPEKFGSLYSLIKKTKKYIVYDYNYKEFPLIALAQGTTVKTKLPRPKDSHFDDILPLISIIKKGGYIAYVTNTGIYHYSVQGFLNLCQKFKGRIYNSIKTSSYASREEYVSKGRKIRRYIFLLYSFSLLPPLIDAIKMAIGKKKLYMLLHPVVSFIISFYILYNFCKVTLWERLK